MEFGVLGPLLMEDAGVSYLPTAPKQRQLLALLLLNANKFVPTELCVKELWDENPPRTVIPTLQTYVLQLRRCLARSPTVGSLSAAHDRLMTGNSGYRLMVVSDRLDLTEFETLARAGRAAQRSGDDRKAADVLRGAVEIWRGPTLSDIDPGPCLRTQINRLEEARISLTEQRFDADLRLGYHQEILSELNAAAAENPLNERLQTQYMLALYRSGRQAQALDLFHQLRKTLTDELGLEPSRPVRRLHEAILTADPSLDLEPSSPAVFL